MPLNSSNKIYKKNLAKIGLIHQHLLCTATLGLQLGLQFIFAKAPVPNKNCLFSHYGKLCMGHSYNITVTDH